MSGRRLPVLVALASATVAVAGLVVVQPAAQAAPATAAAAPVTGAVRTDSLADRIARQEAAERSSRATRSLVGVQPSAYIGPFFNARYERTRQCIVKRESGGYYRVVSSGGAYRGAYQFNQGLGDYAARAMKRFDLVGKPVNMWSRFEQDKAFWVVWNNGSGASHWGGGAWNC
jgi:hypothetical protein